MSRSRKFIDINILRDLHTRYVQNVKSKNQNIIMSHIQQAYWFYIDYMTYNHCSFAQFVDHMSPLLGWNSEKSRNIVKSYWIYSSQLQRCGGVLINQSKTHVLLVKSYGGTKWGFPLGKIMEEEENKKECAEREVFEETGYKGQATDISVTFQNRKSQHTLFLFENVPLWFAFAPQTNKEIGEIAWFEISKLSKIVSIPHAIDNVMELLHNSAIKEQENFNSNISSNSVNSITTFMETICV